MAAEEVTPVQSNSPDYAAIVAGAVEVESIGGGRPAMTEEDIPEPIRKLVDSLYKSGKYARLTVENDDQRALVARRIKSYAQLRSAGRVSATVRLQPPSILLSVGNYEVPKGLAKAAAEKATAAKKQQGKR